MKLTTSEVAFLAKYFDKISTISLFANIGETLNGTEEKSLTEKGILKDGKLVSEANEILGIIAHAKNCTRLILRDSFFVVEKYTYKVEDKIVLTENEDGNFLFSLPDNLDSTISELSEFVGKSKIRSSNIETLFTSEEMLTLLAIVDIYRKNALLNYVGQGDTKEEIPFIEIAKHLLSPSKNSLLQMISNNYKYSIPLAEKILDILENLIKKGCVVYRNGYTLTREYAIFAKGFLIPETVVMIETFSLSENDEVMVSGALCVCAGIRDIISFIFDEDEIEIASISGSQLLQLIENFLKCPDIQ